MWARHVADEQQQLLGVISRKDLLRSTINGGDRGRIRLIDHDADANVVDHVPMCGLTPAIY